MQKYNRKLINIFLRYSIILIASFGNLSLFYFLFTKPTIFVSKAIFSILGETTTIGSYIIFRKFVLEIAPACVAGAAYFFLFFLAFSFQYNSLSRLKLIIYLWGTFFIVNVLRIVFLGLLLGTSFFNSIHLIFWEFLSTIFLILIWFSAVKLFKIREIPVYNDLLIVKNSKNSKTKK